MDGTLVLCQNGIKGIWVVKAVSLFSGAGGMDVGIRRSGFDTVWANDFDKDAVATYRENNSNVIEHGSITDMLDVVPRENISLVYGGPPCQGFSVAGRMRPDDPRSELVFSFMDVVDLVGPSAFVMENVKALAKLAKFSAVREELFKRASAAGYFSKIFVLRACDYGVPQNRERMFFVGMRSQMALKWFERSLIELNNTAPTLREVLLSLPRIGDSGNERLCNAKVTVAAKPVLRKSPYAGMMFNGQGRPLNPNGYASTLPASMGGNRTPIIDEQHFFEGGSEWIAEYHAKLIAGQKPLDFLSAPSRLRRLSVDEAIAIQTFPREYKFAGKNSSIFRQVGNAVPCDLAFAVGCALMEGLQLNHPPDESGTEVTFDLVEQMHELA